MPTGKNSTNGHSPWPTNLDVERVVLGAILIADPEAQKIWDALELDDLSLAKHQTIYRRMRALHHRGQPVDRITLTAELLAHHELDSVDGLSYIVTLDNGLPEHCHPLQYVEILRELKTRRRSIETAGLFAKSMADLTIPPEALLLECRERLESIGGRRGDEIQARGDVWAYDGTLTFVVQDLVLDGGITMFTGEPGAGKSIFLAVLAAAVADGLPFAGMTTEKRPVVYLDREMPVALVKQRLLDLHIERMYPRFRYMGGWEGNEAPGPTSRELQRLARDEHALFIFDPLIRFFQGDENDNHAVRAHLHQYRALTDVGGSVILSHHKSDKSESEYRGASDHKGSVDLGWLVGRDGESLTDNLTRVLLKPTKTRTGGRAALRLAFEGGKFHPLDAPPHPPLDVLMDILRAYPGRNQTELIKLAAPKAVSKHTVEETLNAAVLNRQIEAKRKGKAIRYYLPEPRLEEAE
jgi:hypothetical protein